MSQNFVTYTILDYAGQRSTVSFYLADITALNFDDVLGAGGTIEDLTTAVQTISAGKVESYQVTLPKVILAGAAPNAFAAREVKALFTYEDAVSGELGSFEVAAPDVLTIGPPAGSELFDLDTNIPLSTVVIPNIEAVAKTRDGNALTIVRGRKVGRNI